MKKELVIAFIRTALVPPVVGLILTQLVRHGITINSGWVTSATTLVLSGVWYSIFHLIEVLSTKPKLVKLAGIFLGYPKKPTYVR